MKITKMPPYLNYTEYQLTDHNIVDSVEHLTGKITLEKKGTDPDTFIHFVLVGKINPGSSRVAFRDFKLKDLWQVKSLVDAVAEFVEQKNGEL